jgi:uncharacterized protein (DUF302 family)
MPTTRTRYTIALRLPGTVAELRPRVEAALKAEGFGVLTEIDVAATLKAKLGLDRPPYLILGACNPPLAHCALEADPSVGALLPCNVVLREEHAGGEAGGEAASGGRRETVIEALDPLAALGIVGEPAVEAVAAEARARLERAIASLEERA